MTDETEKGEKRKENGADDDEDDYFDAESEKIFLKGSQKRLRKPPREAQGDAGLVEEKANGACPDYFGVRSYLHHFYGDRTVSSDSTLYEPVVEDDFRYLVTSKKQYCGDVVTSFWWKLAVWGGINFVVLGLIAILVGYVIPKRDVIIGQQDDLEIVDRSAVKFNASLDLCKLVGLIVFCVGGALVMAALLFPGASFSTRDQDDASFGLKMGKLDPRDPTDMKIPSTEQVLRIQPQIDQ